MATSMPLLTSVSSFLIEWNSNGTHGFVKEYPLYVDFLVDQDEYFYLMMIHLILTCVFGLMAVATHDTPYMMLTQHICALFKITG